MKSLPVEGLVQAVPAKVRKKPAAGKRDLEKMGGHDPLRQW